MTSSVHSRLAIGSHKEVWKTEWETGIIRNCVSILSILSHSLFLHFYFSLLFNFITCFMPSSVPPHVSSWFICLSATVSLDLLCCSSSFSPPLLLPCVPRPQWCPMITPMGCPSKPFASVNCPFVCSCTFPASPLCLSFFLTSFPHPFSPFLLLFLFLSSSPFPVLHCFSPVLLSPAPSCSCPRRAPEEQGARGRGGVNKCGERGDARGEDFGSGGGCGAEDGASRRRRFRWQLCE